MGNAGLELQARVLHAMAQPVRLAIIGVLANERLCVGDIAEKVGAKRANVSRHLSVMARAGILDVQRDGVKIVYHLAASCVIPFLSCITDVAKRRIKEGAAVIRRL